jgi:uncharacterized protein (DUF697 family)
VPTSDLPNHPAIASSSAAPSGRLAVLSAFAVAASIIPLPFLPDRLVGRVRGALLHDIGSRHGLSITSDARNLLANAGAPGRHALVNVAENVARTLVRRFIAPIGALTAGARGIEVFALGLLFDRYLREVRSPGNARVEIEEARKIRDVIDRAVVRAVSPTLHPALTTEARGAEDLRDEVTRWSDALLLTSASVPSYVERRLEAAFDEIVREMGLRGE